MEKGQVTEAGIADEEDSSFGSNENEVSHSSDRSSESNQVACLPSRFFEHNGIQEAAVIDEVDEVSNVHRDESPPSKDSEKGL